MVMYYIFGGLILYYVLRIMTACENLHESLAVQIASVAIDDLEEK